MRAVIIGVRENNDAAVLAVFKFELTPHTGAERLDHGHDLFVGQNLSEGCALRV